MTQKSLASYLGVSERTIFNQLEDGYELVFSSDDEVDVIQSAHAYVKHQSEKIRLLSASLNRSKTGNTKSQVGISDQNINWKEEKEKQGAIKLKIANQISLGEFIPAACLTELLNGTLTLFRSKLTGISNQIQKRVPLEPDVAKALDDEAEAALMLLNEKSGDELRDLIRQAILRHSEMHRTAEQDADSSVDEET